MSKEKKEMSKQDKVVYSVIALIAMLIFIVITAIGCARLEKAEAATTSDGLYYPCLWTEVEWGTFSTYKQTIRDTCPDFIIQGNGNSYGYYSIFMFDSAMKLTEGTQQENAPAYYGRYSWYISVHNNQVVQVRHNNNELNAIYYKYAGSYLPMIGGTYDYRHSDMPSDTFRLLPYEAIKEPTYLVNAPYLEYQSVESQSNYINDKIHPIDEGFHIVNYKIMGQPMTPPDGYKVLYEYRVYLPTKDYFYQYLRDDLLIDLNGLNTMQSNIPKWRRNSVGSSDSKLWIFNLDRNIEAEKTNGDDVRIRLDYADIQTEIEEFNSVSLKEYYGFDDDMWGAYGKYIMAHLVVYRVDCIVFTYNTPDVYYGRNITVTFPPYLDNPIVTEYNGDYFNSEYEYDEEIDASIEQALKDAKEESDRLVQEYKDAIAKQENMLGSYDIDFNGEGLWSSFRGLAQGVLGIGSSLSGIAVAFGSVFSFFPADVRGLVGYTFIALCVVAIWKALKS